MRCLVVVLVVLGFAAGCGGSQPPAESPQGAEASSPSTPGAQCLVDAATLRDAPADAPAKIGVAHILVRHVELADPRGATRTKEEACLRALEALEALKSGAGWDETVEKFSDAPGATHGDLGRIATDDVRPPFAGAAFALDVDQLSYVVETDAGFHVILRTE